MLDPSTFRSVLGRFPSGVTVVTAVDDAGQDHDMTVTAFCSVSLQPPLILVCIDHESTMHRVLSHADTFAVNILASSQEVISRRFGRSEADHGGVVEEERFVGVGYTRGIDRAALLDDALAYLECRVFDRHPAGDHTIVIGEVQSAVTREEGPLLYYRGGYALLER